MKNDIKYFIYETTNLVNGNKYIGQHRTKNINDSYLGSGIILKRAIVKYGRDNFKREILEFCSNAKELSEREVYWVKYNNSLTPNGYNITKGGEGVSGYIPTEEQKKEHSRKMKILFNTIEMKSRCRQNMLNLYKSHPERIEHQRISATKQTSTPEWREKFGTLVKNAWNDPDKRKNMSNGEYKAKKYLIIKLDNTYEIVTNLKKWCVDNSYSGVRRVVDGQRHIYKGMLIERMPNIEDKDLKEYCEARVNAYNAYKKIYLINKNAHLKELFNTDDMKNAARDRMNKRLENPETLEMMKQNGIKVSSTPEFRKTKSEMMKEFWKDPEKRKNMSDGKRHLKTYKIYFDNGTMEETTNLQEWCNNRGYKYSCLIAVANGHVRINRDIIKVEKFK